MDMDMGLDASSGTSVGAGAGFDLPSDVPRTGTDAVAVESAISNATGLYDDDDFEEEEQGGGSNR